MPEGKTDFDRLRTQELVYTGVRRTPLCALMGWTGMAEFFATTLDAYLVLGLIPEDPNDCDTADNRPATRACAHARLCRMYGGDADTIPEDRTQKLAQWVFDQQRNRLRQAEAAVRGRLWAMPVQQGLGSFAARVLDEQSTAPNPDRHLTYIASGSGEFLIREIGTDNRHSDGILLSDRLGPEVSACAPAYAVAVLATEGPPPPGGNWLRGAWPWSGRA